MRILTTIFTLCLTVPAFADAFNRSIPQAQSATAEFSYAIACLALILAMAVVQWLVARR